MLAASLPGAVNVANGASLVVQTGSGTTTGWSSSQLGNLFASGGFAAGSVLGVDTTNANATYSGNLTGGTLALTKLGPNAFTLSGSSINSGPINVTAGSMNFTSASPTIGGLSGGGNVVLGSRRERHQPDDHQQRQQHLLRFDLGGPRPEQPYQGRSRHVDSERQRRVLRRDDGACGDVYRDRAGRAARRIEVERGQRSVSIPWGGVGRGLRLDVVGGPRTGDPAAVGRGGNRCRGSRLAAKKELR